MKKKLFDIKSIRSCIPSLLMATIAVASLSGCDIETSDNGDLDGFWHLERIDTLATGGVKDMSNEVVFWSVQAKLMHTQGSAAQGSFYFRFNQTADSLVVSSPYADHWHQDNGDNGGDIPVTDPSAFSEYGINSLEEHFAKESMSGSRMILKSDMLRLYFKKF